MDFNPSNIIVKLCIQGMDMEEKNEPGEAHKLFTEAWDKASNEFEQFLAAYYIARHQDNVSARLEWYERALALASKVKDEAVNGAFPSLYLNIAKCYQELDDVENANKYNDLAILHRSNPSDKGPFYHGTRADVQVGDLLTAGYMSNYKNELRMNHIYFTALPNGAGLAAALAKGDGQERVYIVEPVGSFENDPNVTDKKFPGNPTRSYRTGEPLKVIGEITDWVRQAPGEIQKWRERLANNTGEIIN